MISSTTEKTKAGRDGATFPRQKSKGGGGQIGRGVERTGEADTQWTAPSPSMEPCPTG